LEATVKSNLRVFRQERIGNSAARNLPPSWETGKREWGHYPVIRQEKGRADFLKRKKEGLKR
jgi:hypothetical protein